MTYCTETRRTATIRPTARCGIVTSCLSSTPPARTASTSSASRFGRENGNSVGRKPISFTPANRTPASSSSLANHTPVNGSYYRKTRKDATAGPTRCSGHPAACDHPCGEQKYKNTRTQGIDGYCPTFTEIHRRDVWYPTPVVCMCGWERVIYFINLSTLHSHLWLWEDMMDLPFKGLPVNTTQNILYVCIKTLFQMMRDKNKHGEDHCLTSV